MTHVAYDGVKINQQITESVLNNEPEALDRESNSTEEGFYKEFRRVSKGLLQF